MSRSSILIAFVTITALCLPGAEAIAAGKQYSFENGSLTFGATARIRTMSYSPTRFGIGGENDSYTLYRAQFSADLRWAEHWQAFTDIGAYDTVGRKGGPGSSGRSGPDLHQAYLGWSNPDYVLRLGRQEMAFGSNRLIDLRDGQNIRLAFDGIRAAKLLPANGRVDVIAVRPVQSRSGSFDDRTDKNIGLWGVYASLVPAATAPIKLDVYWLGYQRESARFAEGAGREYRQSFGTRLHGNAAGFDWNSEVIWQNGRFADGDIQAWMIATDSGYTFQDAAWKPRLSLRANIASGDKTPNDRRLQTFNSLFPKSSYYSQASLLAPANLVDIQPAITVMPNERMQWTLGWDFAWKHRRADAVYTTPTPLTPLPGTAGGSKWIGQQIKLEGSWKLAPHWEARLHLAHFEVGSAIREAGGKNTNFVSTIIQFDW
ncbi:MAG: alginate export family protein [Pseudomonadota bacterium]|nr:alginate export family protein [Pseudomonadota bacterium]